MVNPLDYFSVLILIFMAIIRVGIVLLAALNFCWALEDVCSSVSDNYSDGSMYLLACYLFRNKQSLCNECLSIEGCGYCASTGMCMMGDESAPVGSVSCPNWVYSNTLCPGIFYIFLFTSCSSM